MKIEKGNAMKRETLVRLEARIHRDTLRELLVEAHRKATTLSEVVRQRLRRREKLQGRPA